MTEAFCAALICAARYLPLAARTHGIWRSAIKTAPLTMFAGISALSGAAPALTAAFALSSLGDLALSRPGTRAFLTGLVAFALAHIAYLWLFLAQGAALSLAWAAGLALLVLSIELWLIPHTGALRWPVRVYAVLIALMAWAAAGLPAERSLAAWGAAAFLASDMILSIQLFRLSPNSPLSRPAGWLLWVLYVGGQALILLALVPGIGLF